MDYFETRKERQRSGLIFATIGTFDIEDLRKLKRNKRKEETCVDYLSQLKNSAFTKKSTFILKNHRVNNQLIITNFADSPDDLFNVSYIENHIIKNKRSYLMKHISLSSIFSTEYINSISKKYKQTIVTLSDPCRNKVYINDRYMYFCVDQITKVRLVNHKVLFKDRKKLQNVLVIDLYNGESNKKKKKGRKKGKEDLAKNTNSVELTETNMANKYNEWVAENVNKDPPMIKEATCQKNKTHNLHQHANIEEASSDVFFSREGKENAIEKTDGNTKEKWIGTFSKLRTLYETFLSEEYFEPVDLLGVFGNEENNLKQVLQNIFINNNSTNAKVYSLTLKGNESFYETEEEMIEFNNPDNFLLGMFSLNENPTVPNDLNYNFGTNTSSNNNVYFDSLQHDTSHRGDNLQNSTFNELSSFDNYSSNVLLYDPLQVGYGNNLSNVSINEETVNQIYSSIFDAGGQEKSSHLPFVPSSVIENEKKNTIIRKDAKEDTNSFSRNQKDALSNVKRDRCVNEENMFQSGASRQWNLSSKRNVQFYELDLQKIEKSVFLKTKRAEKIKKMQNCCNEKRESNNISTKLNASDVDIYDIKTNENKYFFKKEKTFFVNCDASYASSCSSTSLSFLKEKEKGGGNILKPEQSGKKEDPRDELHIKSSPEKQAENMKKEKEEREENKKHGTDSEESDKPCINRNGKTDKGSNNFTEKKWKNKMKENIRRKKKEEVCVDLLTDSDTESDVERKLEEYKWEMENYRNKQLQKVSNWIFVQKIMGHLVSETYTSQDFEYMWDKCLKRKENASEILKKKKKFNQFVDCLMDYIGRIHFDIKIDNEENSYFLINRTKHFNKVQKITFNNGLIHISAIYDVFNFLIDALIIKSELNKNKLYYVLSFFSPDSNFIYCDKYVQTMGQQNAVHFFFFYCNGKVHITLLNTETRL